MYYTFQIKKAAEDIDGVDDETASMTDAKSDCDSTSTALSSISSKTGISRHKQSQNALNAASFLRRPPTPNGIHSTSRDLAAIKRMFRLNNASRNRIFGPNSKDIGYGKTTLPKIGQTTVPFHTQRSLLRSNNPNLVQTADPSSEEEEDSSEESSESSDSDD
jgi:hypothetical protein